MLANTKNYITHIIKSIVSLNALLLRMSHLSMALISHVPGALHTVYGRRVANGNQATSTRHHRYVAKQQTITAQVTHLYM